jgi:hypothetical protein
MTLNKSKFDFYYLIICSRGPGTETITTKKMTRDELTTFEFDDTAIEDFNAVGIASGQTEDTDEGPVICMPKHKMELNKLWQWLVLDTARSAEAEPIQIDDIFKHELFAYVSALFRAFVIDNITTDENPWTSVNAWRNIESEILTIEQFKKVLEALQTTPQQLLQTNCAVLKECAMRYENGTLQ